MPPAQLHLSRRASPHRCLRSLARRSVRSQPLPQYEPGARYLLALAAAAGRLLGTLSSPGSHIAHASKSGVHTITFDQFAHDETSQRLRHATSPA